NPNCESSWGFVLSTKKYPDEGMSYGYFANFLHFVYLSSKKHGYYPAAHRVTNPAPEDCRVSTDPVIAADRDHPGAVTPAQVVPRR
ncbi:hypothetical protein, partial [Pseudomonas botevensis]|uniref:hypothetical protein n=1 Tax=Pseudomonas botevensis TaxID=2842352 RepID=UPI001C3D455D